MCFRCFTVRAWPVFFSRSMTHYFMGIVACSISVDYWTARIVVSNPVDFDEPNVSANSPKTLITFIPEFSKALSIFQLQWALRAAASSHSSSSANSCHSLNVFCPSFQIKFVLCLLTKAILHATSSRYFGTLESILSTFEPTLSMSTPLNANSSSSAINLLKT